MSQISKHFSWEEATCKCGCGTVYADPMLVGLLEAIRARFIKPVTVLSWCRCLAHNEAVGGATNSYHLSGQACDIYIAGEPLEKIADEAILVGADGVSIYPEQGFVHVDVRGYPARW